MIPFRQDIRFAPTADGWRIAYAVSGKGYPLVRAGIWMSHLDLDWRTDVLGALFTALSAQYRLYRYDPRGYGLSEGDGADVTLDSLVADLEAMVAGAGLQRFALWGPTSASSVTAIAYAARHPDRVSHLVLTGPVARGVLSRPKSTPEERDAFLAFVKLIETGWGDDNPAFRQIQTTRMWPEATAEQVGELNELLRRSAKPRHAARMVLATGQADVSALLQSIRCPTLILHCRRALLMPIDEARLIVSSIPGARFVSLESGNYMPVRGESAFAQLIEEIRAFLPARPASEAKTAPLGRLTPREHEVLDLVARGLDNDSIAGQLAISEKTVRNTVSRIFDKLAVRSRAQAVVFARRAGLGD